MELFAQPLEEGSVNLEALLASLKKYKFRFFDEEGLQSGLSKVFESQNIPFVREKSLNRADRPDFLVAGGIAIEVKIKGSLAQFLRQASRYLEDPRVQILVIIGTPAWISKVPAALHGKPIYKHRLISSLI